MLYDVIIIGGGVSGTAAAWFLSQAGLRIALLDKQPPCLDKICTTAINPRSVSYLKKIGILQSLEDKRYVKIKGLQTFAYDNSSFQGFYKHETSYPDYGYCIPRYKLDLALRESILNRENVDYFEPFNVEKVELCHVLKLVTVEGAQKEGIKKIQGKIVIDAMGRHSIIGKQHGLFHSDDAHKRFAILAQFSGLNFFDSMFTIGTNDDIGPGYYTIFPMQSDGLAMIALIIPEKNWLNMQENLNNTLKNFVSSKHWPLQHWFVEAKQESKTLSFGPIAFHSQTFTLPHIFMVGDSTGFYDPLTGEGLTQAFRTGEWASQAIIQFFNGQSFEVASEWYSHKVREYKEEALQHSRQLQDLLKLPNAFNRFIYSLSQNQEAANWLACAVGNILPQGERSSGRLKELLFSSKITL